MKRPRRLTVCQICIRPLHRDGFCSPWTNDTSLISEPREHTMRNGWKLMFWFMWDAMFHRGPDPHMQRAIELTREDQMHRGD